MADPEVGRIAGIVGAVEFVKDWITYTYRFGEQNLLFIRLAPSIEGKNVFGTEANRENGKVARILLPPSVFHPSVRKNPRFR